LELQQCVQSYLILLNQIMYFLGKKMGLTFLIYNQRIQCILINRMIKELNFDIEMNICDIVREKDGLALSSRNIYLNKEERALSPLIYQLLINIKEAFQKKITNKNLLTDIGKEFLFKYKDKIKLEYISFADLNTG
jgi:pantoate--beta-alanine ligase